MKVFVLVLAVVIGLASTKPNPKPNPRIIGGKEAKPHSIPYQAFIQLTVKNTETFYCGGSLIYANVILTSASCLKGATSVLVVLGAQDPFEPEAEQEQITSTDFVIHHDFNSHTKENDIGLIKLPYGVDLDGNINVVPLAQGSSDYAGSKGKLSGWGLTDGESSESISEVLRYIEDTIISSSDCSKYINKVGKKQICISGNNYKGSCVGDTGGPLTVNGELVGVASFEADICPKGFPSVATRVTSYLDWIAENI